ncbi:hypothetical protein MPSEU_001002600 [Mayamaea pseudoterrestris]|nr:hypothetical protein MPSEU_001002600 [Mayamaea pseudoterrestris]
MRSKCRSMRRRLTSLRCIPILVVFLYSLMLLFMQKRLNLRDDVYLAIQRGYLEYSPATFQRNGKPLALIDIYNQTHHTSFEAKSSATAPLGRKLPPAERDVTLIGNQLYPIPLRPSNEAIWEQSTILPQWAKDYFAWHCQQRKTLTQDNWSNMRYIVMGCFHSDAKCGGTADRLQPLPFVLRAAAKSKHMLFIHWDVPGPLEAFLLPPQGGINWRLPEDMHEHIAAIPQEEVIRTVTVFLHQLENQEEVITRIRIQSHTHGSEVYNEWAMAMGESPHAWREHFHDIWYTFFTPAPTIAKTVEDEMERSALVPGKFAFAHIRALYEFDPGNESIKKWAENALNCVSELNAGPYFVSSDSYYAKEVAVEYGKRRNVRVVAHLDGQDPVHVDRVKDLAFSELYPVFIDLYIMSFGDCMVYNMGNFGLLAKLISGRNSTCKARHWTIGVNKASAKKEGCQWINWTSHFEQAFHLQRPLFLSPMY